MDCDGGVRIFTQNAGHCVYDRGDAPDVCSDTIPHRYETMNDVVCSQLDDLSDEWLATIIEASFYQDAGPTDASAAADAAVDEPAEQDAGAPLDIDASPTGTVIRPSEMDTP